MPAVGRGLHVSVVPILLDVIPRPEAQRGLLQPRQVEGAGERHVAIVAAHGVPRILSAVDIGIRQAHLSRAGELDTQIALAQKFNVVGGVLVNRTRPLGGISAMGVVNSHGPHVQIGVTVAPIIQTGVIHQIGDQPVGEHLIKSQPVIGENSVEPGDSVGVLSYHRARRLLTEAVEEISHQQVAGPVVQVRFVGFGPGGELDVGLLYEGLWRVPNVVVVEVGCQFGASFVDPPILVAVVVPVDHVLELVGQHPIVEIGVW